MKAFKAMFFVSIWLIIVIFGGNRANRTDDHQQDYSAVSTSKSDKFLMMHRELIAANSRAVNRANRIAAQLSTQDRQG